MKQHTPVEPEFDESHAEIQQRLDPPIDAIPVYVTRTVRTRDVPPVASGILTFELDALTPIRLLTADKRRIRATIIAFTNNIELGTTASQALNNGATWPNLGPLVWAGPDELWAIAATATATVTVIIDQWAD